MPLLCPALSHLPYPCPPHLLWDSKCSSAGTTSHFLLISVCSPVPLPHLPHGLSRLMCAPPSRCQCDCYHVKRPAPNMQGHPPPGVTQPPRTPLWPRGAGMVCSIALSHHLEALQHLPSRAPGLTHASCPGGDLCRTNPAQAPGLAKEECSEAGAWAAVYQLRRDREEAHPESLS